MRLGKQNLPHLTVAGEIFTVYQQVIGAAATLVWLNMRYSVAAEQPFDPGLLRLSGLSQDDILEAISLWRRTASSRATATPLSSMSLLAAKLLT